MFQPTLKVFGQSERSRVTALRILFEALQTNRGKIAI
jgi:hypothetical protein